MQLNIANLHAVLTALPAEEMLENGAAAERLAELLGHATRLRLDVSDMDFAGVGDFGGLIAELSLRVTNAKARAARPRKPLSELQLLARKVCSLPRHDEVGHAAYQKAYRARIAVAAQMLELRQAGVAPAVEFPVKHGELAGLLAKLRSFARLVLHKAVVDAGGGG